MTNAMPLRPPRETLSAPVVPPPFIPIAPPDPVISSARRTATGTIHAVIDGRDVYLSDDAIGPDREALTRWVTDGGSIEPYVLPALTLADYEAALLTHLDATAVARGYAHQDRLAGYVADPNPTWAADAAAFVAWRSAVWHAAYAVLAKAEGGAPPPTVQDFIAALPAMVWAD